MTVIELEQEIWALSAQDRAELFRGLEWEKLMQGLGPAKLLPRFGWDRSESSDESPRLNGRHRTLVSYNGDFAVGAEYTREDALELLKGLILYHHRRSHQHQDIDLVNRSSIDGFLEVENFYLLARDTFVRLNEVASEQFSNELYLLGWKHAVGNTDRWKDEPSQLWLSQKATDAENYIRFHLARRLCNAVQQLFEESVFDALREPVSAADRQRLQNYTSIPPCIPTRGRGGANRKSRHFKRNADFLRFAEKVDQLLPLWTNITKYFKQADYDSGCVKSVKEMSWFETHSSCCQEIPEDLLRKVFERQNRTLPQLWPLGFALEHARRELDVSALSFSTLKKYYERGKKLLNS